jgi:hypothetical protein
VTVTNNVSPTVSSAAQQALYDMMNASSTGVTGTLTTETDGSSPPVYLTPQALMVYCQTRLQGIDSQVQTAMTAQQNTNWEQGEIGTLLSAMATDSNATTNGVTTDPKVVQTLELDLENLITQIQQRDPGCQQLGALEQLHDSMMATGTGPYPPTNTAIQGYYCSSPNGPNGAPAGKVPPSGSPTNDGVFSTGDFTNFTSTLNNINSSLSSGAEMGMINIQSLMSDRTTAIQLTTSILQSYDDGVEKIADNIGK